MHKTHAFTRTELLILLAVTGLFAAIHLPLLAATRGRADLAQCTSNLQQVGAAMRIWSDEHGGRLPYLVPAAEGGTYQAAQVVQHYSALSNHLTSPRILTCPSSGRVPATSWRAIFESNPSYVLGLHGLRGDPREMWLLESRLSGGGSGNCSVAGGLSATAYSAVFGRPFYGYYQWTSGYHENLGNILMGDGSVALTSSSSLPYVFASQPPVSAEGNSLHILTPR